MTDNMRETLGRWLFERSYGCDRNLATPDVADWDEYVERNREEWRAEADELLALPAVRAALDAQEAVRRVTERVDAIDADDEPLNIITTGAIRRLLAGES